MTRLRAIVLCLGCLAFLAACTTPIEPVEPQPDTAIGSTPVLVATEEPAPVTSPQAGGTGALIPTPPSELVTTVEMAPVFTANLMEALGADLQLSPQDIRLLSFASVDWPNSCLGVEREGVMCMDVITPGYLLVFETSSGNYEAHTNSDGSRYQFLPLTTLSTTPP